MDKKIIKNTMNCLKITENTAKEIVSMLKIHCICLNCAYYCADCAYCKYWEGCNAYNGSCSIFKPKEE